MLLPNAHTLPSCLSTIVCALPDAVIGATIDGFSSVPCSIFVTKYTSFSLPALVPFEFLIVLVTTICVRPVTDLPET